MSHVLDVETLHDPTKNKTILIHKHYKHTHIVTLKMYNNMAVKFNSKYSELLKYVKYVRCDQNSIRRYTENRYWYYFPRHKHEFLGTNLFADISLYCRRYSRCSAGHFYIITYIVLSSREWKYIKTLGDEHYWFFFF